MTARDFAYWLQGYFEIAKPTSADTETLSMIQKHLNMVFVHDIDPTHGGPEEQEKLNAIHNVIETFPTQPIPTPAPFPPKKLNGGAIARC